MTNDKATTGAALAKRESAVDIVSPLQFNEYIAERQREHAHVLSPVTQIGSVPAMWKIVPTLVYINPDPAGGEVYRDPLFCDGDEVALTKVGLRKVAQAATLTTRVQRIDSQTVPNLWEFLGKIRWRGFDAQFHEFEAPMLWDLRDGSEFVKRLLNAAERNEKRQRAKVSPADWIKKQLDAARFHGYRNGASRAVNAAIREFGLRQKYTRQDLSKPFVCFAMVVNPDMGDAEQRRIVLQAALGVTPQLYPAATAALPQETDPLADPDDPPVNHATGEIIEGDTVRSGPAQTATAVPFDEESEPGKKDADPTYHISGVFRDGANFFLTTVETGELKIWTDDKSAAQSAVSAKKANSALVMEMEKRGAETWLVGFSEAVKL